MRLGALICPFCAVAITLLACHRTSQSDAGAEGSTRLTVDTAGARAPVYGGPPVDPAALQLEMQLAAMADAGHSTPSNDAGASPLPIELTVEGPTAPGDERTVASLRYGFVGCVTRALDAGAVLAGTFTVIVTIAKNGDVLAATLAEPKALPPHEGDCLIQKTNSRSFGEGPERTLRIVVKPSLASRATP